MRRCVGFLKGGPEVKQLGPLPRILGTGDLAVGGVHERIGAISQQPAVGDLSSIQLLAQHGLHGIPPQGSYLPALLGAI